MQLEYKVLFFHAALSKSVIERALSKSVIEEHYRKSVIEEHYRRASPKNIIKRTLSKSIIEKQRFSHFFPFAAAASAARKSKKVVCQKVPHHHHHCSPHLGKVEVAFPVLMEQINNQRIDSQPDERHRKELQVFHSHLRRGAAPRPNAIQNIVRSSCQNETYGLGQKLVDAKNFLAHIGHPKVNQRARHSHHTKLQKFQHQRSQQVHCQQLESLFRSLVNDTRFAHALLLFVVLGLADAWTRFLLARQIFHVACSVHLQAVHLLRVQIHLHAPILISINRCKIMPTFKTIRELIRGLQNGYKLLIDMFNKRKTVAIRYDDALETLDGDENKLRYLISHGVIIQTNDTLELDDNYLHFFENVLEVNEDINVASVQQYIGKLMLNINSYLAADTDKRKSSFMRDIRHTFHSIAQMTRRNIIDLKRNVEDTYKQEPNFKLKKIRLIDFDKKCTDIVELIRQTEKIMDEQTIFFSSAMDVLLRQTINDVRAGLRESSHGLIDIQKQIIDYLNRIEYQSRLVKKIRQLKYLKDQFMLEENTDVKVVLSQRNPVWMEPVARFTTKVSIDCLRNDDAALAILSEVRNRLSKKMLID